MTDNQMISHVVDLRSFIPIVYKCTAVVNEDLNLHRHVLVHLSVAPVVASWHHPPYMLQFFTTTSYMLASELWCSIILFHHVHLVLLGSVFYISDQLHPLASLIVFLYVIFRHVLFSIRIRWPIMYFQFFILVYIVDPLLLDMHAWFTFSEHGYAHIRQLFLADLFLMAWQVEIWWSPFQFR